MSKKYWDEFYRTTFNEKECSPFCFSILDDIGGTVLDLGCGNGRDTKQLYYNHCKVIVCDYSIEALSSSIVRKYAEEIIICDLQQKFPTVSGIDYIYSRFFLHCFPPKRQKEILKWALQTARLGCFFECRAYDNFPYYNFPASFDHKRYLVKPENLIYTLNGFTNIYYEITVAKNLAIYKDENPLILRLITWK